MLCDWERRPDGSSHSWINMWVAGKTVILITHAIPEHFRDEFITKRYTNVRIYLYPLAFYYSIVIMHVSCTFLRQRDIGRKTSTLSCLTCVCLEQPVGWLQTNFITFFDIRKLKWRCFRGLMYSRVGRTPTCDEQTGSTAYTALAWRRALNTTSKVILSKKWSKENQESNRLTKYGMCVRARVRACVHVTCVNHKEYLTEDNILQLESWEANLLPFPGPIQLYGYSRCH